ncbi:hypothetical protein BZG36_02767 [Bifiguratus adelaidae]|uniref:G-protein coupled receptors family 2 profile 2 domain-containing protein n=1 Tax=Bifiguratus adelaidae TaxID=1938954 RepID=A0A261Y1X8_9FUNG|nr:hypothetical protein BZG36_02767 [Bifiguratus adelaidae]
MENVTALYPNTPTPNLPPSSWDFDPGYNLVLQGEEANRIFMLINLVLNPLSILGGLTVCTVVLMIRLYEKSLMDRVSLRLTVVVSAIDAVKAAAYIIFTFVATPGETCAATSWLVLFLTNAYTFLSVAIAFNLQWIFLHRHSVRPWLESAYFILAFGLALATTIPPWADGRLGLDPNYGVCWYRSYSTKRTILWEWTTFLFWNIAGTLYCFVVVIAVVVKLRFNTVRTLRLQAENMSMEDVKAKRQELQINKLAWRISLYALIPLVTQMGWFISEIVMQFGHYLDVNLNWWLIVGTDLPGVLNLAAFLCDPALWNSIARIQRDMIDRYGDKTVFRQNKHYRQLTPLKKMVIYLLLRNAVMDQRETSTDGLSSPGVFRSVDYPKSHLYPDSMDRLSDVDESGIDDVRMGDMAMVTELERGKRRVDPEDDEEDGDLGPSDSTTSLPPKAGRIGYAFSDASSQVSHPAYSHHAYPPVHPHQRYYPDPSYRQPRPRRRKSSADEGVKRVMRGL